MDYVNVLVVGWLPPTAAGLTVRNSDGTYTVFINACLNAEKQMQAYLHELQHIEANDFDYIFNVDELEAARHMCAM